MRIVTAAVMASTLAVSSLSHAAEVGSGDNWHPGEELTQRSTQSHMFDGISLTEHQRQQIDAPRDKCTLSCAINGIHAAFHYLKKNYISGCVMTVPTG